MICSNAHDLYDFFVLVCLLDTYSAGICSTQLYITDRQHHYGRHLIL